MLKTIVGLFIAVSVAACSGADFDVAAGSPMPVIDSMSGSEDAQPDQTEETSMQVDSADSGAILDSAVIKDSGFEASSDTSTSIHDSASTDTGSLADTAEASVANEHTIVELPGEGAFGFNGTSGATGDPTAIGYSRMAGDYMEELFKRLTTMRKLHVEVVIDDQTQGCAKGSTNVFTVNINGKNVGSLSFITGSTVGERTLTGDFSASIDPSGVVGGKVRIEAASTVCVGGGSWQWRKGGLVVADAS
jgi:hypothetical protein